MEPKKILWVDDEIDLLKPYIIFLTEKGYDVKTSNNGDDAINMVKSEIFDIILLDENMPGLSGIEVLSELKIIAPLLPVVMITKHEEENIMDDAIGAKINDYLIKPVKPQQILLTIKKNLDQKELITNKTTTHYQSEFTQLSLQINDCRNIDDWKEIYKKLVYWELELDRYNISAMAEILDAQKTEANNLFSKFIAKKYLDWVNENPEKRPLLSTDIFKKLVYPKLDKNKKFVLILIDNLRYDQWLSLLPLILEHYRIEDEKLYTSILPTTTYYARNAIFSGLFPMEIAKKHPNFWVKEDEEGKNLHENDFIAEQLKRHYREESFYYYKILNHIGEKKIITEINDILQKDLIVLVYNFIDILSHVRTEEKVVRELSNNESAYRSLSTSWFKYSELLTLIKILSEKNISIAITTDHGSINVKNAIQIIGEKSTNTNLRYKVGRNLNYNRKKVYTIAEPRKAKLPTTTLSSTFVFANNNDFFAYPNNFNHYVTYYKDTFQHGGISLEEMLIPYTNLVPR